MKKLTRPLEMIWATIPAGSFIMGSSKKQVDQIKQLDPGYSDEWLNREQPQHEVYLSQFEISIYPVTNRQFREFVSSTGYQTERELDGLKKSVWHQFPFNKTRNSSSMEEILDHPVVCVTVSDALNYCQWLAQHTGDNINLPTEAQWEKSSRGGDDRLWPWGNQFDENKCNITGRGTTIVGSYPSGVSPYGVMDCAGNVWEWCEEAIYPYDGFKIDPVYREMSYPFFGFKKICKGGAFCVPDFLIHPRYRNAQYPDCRIQFIGFRVCKNINLKKIRENRRDKINKIIEI